MKRNVIEMGGKTYVVSLPAPWIKKYGIKKGDELEVIEEGEKIVVSSGRGPVAKNVKIDVSGLDSALIYRLIHAAYIRGADEIKAVFSNKKESELAHKALATLIGYVIIDEGKDYIKAKDVHGPATEFDPILKRVFFTLNNLILDNIQALKEGKLNISFIKEKDYEIGESINFCLRYLNKRGYSDHRRNMMIYSTLRNIENLGDEYCHLFEVISKNKIEKKLLEILGDLGKMFKEYSELFYTYDKDKAIALVSYKKKIKANTLLFSKKISKSEIIGPLWAIATRTFDLIEPKLEEAY
ncbi:MAG: AbrB/MazE/SpoVT family DNA-binding domain-containing protein [Nanoarchaeota archaeon]|nr:AbrB/MazE/SpoVT family DNA-binding domain-containing protein [Nanoarchaeota archaeon]